MASFLLQAQELSLFSIALTQQTTSSQAQSHNSQICHRVLNFSFLNLNLRFSDGKIHHFCYPFLFQHIN
ncbi:hypothetical protein E1A91_D10G206400v1 [Gossypium mustelinum]|uniref:Uncharacterized protein n=1 Tax=Gossypium mustelinum TaxID=34275 RepID=A0A5D2TAY5_GOSMU|nr:hypothetical protein E1A91_D10G206400v1 [Gossypium mustelinum]